MNISTVGIGIVIFVCVFSVVYVSLGIWEGCTISLQSLKVDCSDKIEETIYKEKAAEVIVDAHTEIELKKEEIIESVSEVPTFVRQVNVREGRIKLIEYKTKEEDIALQCNNRDIHYWETRNTLYFFVSASYNSVRKYNCTLNNTKIAEITVIDGKFDEKIHRINISNNFIEISPEKERQIKNDRILIDRAYGSSEGRILFQNKFVNPYTKFEILSGFGEKRIFQNGHRTQHNGTDYALEIGETIYTIGDGVVRLAKDLFFCGKTIIIDHGIDIASVYCHLNEISVKVGDTVSAGDSIGLSGNTGLSNIPHLHLVVRHRNDWIDSKEFVEYINKITINNK